MATLFRVTARAGASIGETDTIEGLVELTKGARPGRYEIERISFDPTTGDLRSWRFGSIRKTRSGVIELDLPPWLD